MLVGDRAVVGNLTAFRGTWTQHYRPGRNDRMAVFCQPSVWAKKFNICQSRPIRVPTRGGSSPLLSPHVLLRPGELRQAEWSDIDFDEAIWFIPGQRMKMRRPHRVPLSRQVIAMLKELHEHTHWWKYLFPCLGKPRKPMSENAVNQGLRKLALHH